jgi:hypothetical protein
MRPGVHLPQQIPHAECKPPSFLWHGLNAESLTRPILHPVEELIRFLGCDDVAVRRHVGRDLHVSGRIISRMPNIASPTGGAKSSLC